MSSQVAAALALIPAAPTALALLVLAFRESARNGQAAAKAAAPTQR